MRIACITMVYNEPVFLPLWAGYYGRQVDFANLYCMDHGSDDGSTRHLKLNYLRLPRGPLDEQKRALWVSQFHRQLLGTYDVVIYADVDEFLVPDPARYAGLADYCRRLTATHATALGVNVLHLHDAEPPIDPSRPILAQRRVARFAAAYCKTLIARVPVDWDVGFHHCDLTPNLDPNLVLFHLKFIDRDLFRADHPKRAALKWSEASLRYNLTAQWRLPPERYEEIGFPLTAATLPTARHDDFSFTADIGKCPFYRPNRSVHFDGAVAEIPERYRLAIPGIGDN